MFIFVHKKIASVFLISWFLYLVQLKRIGYTLTVHFPQSLEVKQKITNKMHYLPVSNQSKS